MEFGGLFLVYAFVSSSLSGKASVIICVFDEVGAASSVLSAFPIIVNTVIVTRIVWIVRINTDFFNELRS